jgi:hypothetical protein
LQVEITKRLSIVIVVLCALSLAAFEESAELTFFLSLPQPGPTDPSGKWDRADSTHLTLLIYHDPQGAWIVESMGVPRRGQPENACRGVYAGSLNGTELATTSDGTRDTKDTLTRDNLARYQGLFVDVRGKLAKVTGPESEAPECPLAGVYVRASPTNF